MKYIEIDNNDYNIHNQLGVVYLEIGESGKACTILERSLELNPRQPSVRESLDAVKKSTSAQESETIHSFCTYSLPLKRLF